MRIYEWNKGVADAKGMTGGLGKLNAKKLSDLPAEGNKVRQEEDSFRSSLQKSMHVRMETGMAGKTGREVPARRSRTANVTWWKLMCWKAMFLRPRGRKQERERNKGDSRYM